MKIDRLVAILVILLGKERVQAKDLAEKFEVSVRTILRDIEAINQAGIPIVTFQGANGGIGIAEGYRLDKSVLTADEMAAIISTLQGIDGAVNTRTHAVLMDKLKNSLTMPQLETLDNKLNRIVIDLSPWQDDAATREKLAVILSAIETCKPLEFSYNDSGGVKTRRTVEPYSLILKAQNWYVYAWCTLRNNFRYFRVSRLAELVTLEAPFIPRQVSPQPLPERQLLNQIGTPVELELAFIEELESIVEEFFREGIHSRRGGRIIVKTTMPENRGVLGLLLSFGAGVEVINPPHIRQKMAEIATEISQIYQ
ncbi:MAG: YafY family transcriptional regulator [Chloroflexi bacterium HGW-Chloroflexi-4]|nr:MAG: YafY family transcriptional regulator [Chloroflexi bacterium HGW-Chloroflexi-4]